MQVIAWIFELDGKSDVIELLKIELVSHRRKYQLHVLGMIGVGWVGESWLEQLEPRLAAKLQALLAEPEE